MKDIGNLKIQDGGLPPMWILNLQYIAYVVTNQILMKIENLMRLAAI